MSYYDDYYDDDQGPLDSPEIGDREQDHVWADLARSESEFDEPDEDEPTYMVRRFCFNDRHEDHRKVILTGLTLDEAQAHCQDDATRGEDAERGSWFDGYDEE